MYPIGATSRRAQTSTVPGSVSVMLDRRYYSSDECTSIANKDCKQKVRGTDTTSVFRQSTFLQPPEGTDEGRW